MSSLNPASESQQKKPWVFFATGFRPFFWFGAVTSCAWMVLWLLLLSGVEYNVNLPLPYWHAHEMLFGFVSAIIAGFLLTAVKSWTGRPTASGFSLFFLLIVWIAGRVVMLLANNIPDIAIAIIDTAFVPCLLFFVGRPIIATRNTRNMGILAILGGLIICNTLFHLSWMGYLSMGIIPFVLQTVINVVTLLMVIIGGRVIPAFTQNRLPGVKIYQLTWLNHLALTTTAVFLIIETIPSMEKYAGYLGIAAGSLNFIRLLGWGWHKTFPHPLLWILNLGYLWICAGLVAKGLNSSYLIDDYRNIALHMLATGAMGTLILGMMSRVALGHTGRPMELPHGMLKSYIFITLAAITRVSAPLLPMQVSTVALFLAGGLWVAAYLIFLYYYTPILWKSRIDGRPG
ncbi:NnrS family protein [Candidatus Nitrosacidococcus sp. I8]|uniref:NnrS family protein n=1 Tax=Candidatus Nitrosacidococcus sp. I8 TaxID=2942908 RepID=UPI002227B832|nr:NnrS family protein [Candidatus Nitrosacidococcus sp. I8]CAH9018112.1 hypothetical protein NURINAE_00734 [Candidatus Nitrosacidococcus sp. I8]